MSLDLCAELIALRAEVGSLRDRIAALEGGKSESGPAAVVPVTVNYHASALSKAPVAPALTSSAAQLPEVPTSSTPGLTPGGRITASAYTEDYRREIALGIGDYFIRCLRGVNRGPSGRHKISLPSKVYVLVRDIEGRAYDPVGVYHTFAGIRPLVRDGDFLGDSIFCGFPTTWEARAAVQRTGLTWPA